MKLKSEHIPFERLADLAEGRLAAKERDSVLSHMGACQRCSAQLESLRDVIDLMRTDKAEDAPRGAVAYAVGLFRSRTADAQEKPSLVRRVMAALSFDSFQAAPAFGLRSGQAATARQLLYSAGEHDLDLRLSQSGERWTISGQVLGECEGGEARLEGGEQAVSAELNEQCEFTLPAVGAGGYTLRLRLADREIEIPEIKLD